MNIDKLVKNLLVDLEKDEYLSFEKAEEIVKKVKKTKYDNGKNLTIEDQIKVVEKVADEVRIRGYSIDSLFYESSNREVVTAIGEMLKEIKKDKEDKKSDV